MTQVVRLGALSEAMWQQLIAGEHEPWGPVGAQLRWSDKPLNIAIRDAHGRLLAAGGIVLAEARVGAQRLELAGIGGVIVTAGARGGGLGRMLVAALLEAAAELDVQRAMLFCRPGLVPFYASFGFSEIEASVSAEQPGGRIEMPLRAMWKALHGEPRWPPGPVELSGEPF